MSVGSFTQVVSAISKLLGTVLWPVAALIVIGRLLPDIRKVLARGGVNLKAGGVELSLEKASEAAAAIGAASSSKGGTGASPQEIAATILSLSNRGVRPDKYSERVLWVDDHPENNEYERQALSAIGIGIDLAKSTDQALSMLGDRNYSLIISDLGRRSSSEDDTDAGLTLLRRVRSQLKSMPYIIYAGSRAITEHDRIIAAGATYATNSPTDLVSAVVRALDR